MSAFKTEYPKKWANIVHSNRGIACPSHRGPCINIETNKRALAKTSK